MRGVNNKEVRHINVYVFILAVIFGFSFWIDVLEHGNTRTIDARKTAVGTVLVLTLLYLAAK